MPCLGILGGGQLARMLALKAHEMGVPVRVFCQSENEPAALVTAKPFIGQLDSATDLKEFLKSVDVATFESEFLNAELLASLSRELKIPIYPDPKHMGQLQDRLTQKLLLLENKIPTARFLEVRNFADLLEAWDEFHKQGLVLKKRRFGYDGYGTYIVKNFSELLDLEATIEKERFGFIAEEFVSFKRELAVMVTRNRNHEITVLPFVESLQKNSKCFWVKGPINKPEFKKIGKRLKSFLEDIKYVGIMGIEFFDTSDGLIVNEIAPRVHNSGHYSLDALTEDQFTLHIKAVLGFKSAKVKLLSPGFAMVNLLGTSTLAPIWQLPAEVKLHWYGKSENRRGRKMGHYNILDKNPNTALKRGLAALKNFQL